MPELVVAGVARLGAPVPKVVLVTDDPVRVLQTQALLGGQTGVGVLLPRRSGRHGFVGDVPEDQLRRFSWNVKDVCTRKK